MLPTAGLFRSIPCPYYVSGLCERPHCLFRHTKSDIVGARVDEDEECGETVLEDSVNGADKDKGLKTTSATVDSPSVPLRTSTPKRSLEDADPKIAVLEEPKKKKLCKSQLEGNNDGGAEVNGEKEGKCSPKSDDQESDVILVFDSGIDDGPEASSKKSQKKSTKPNKEIKEEKTKSRSSSSSDHRKSPKTSSSTNARLKSSSSSESSISKSSNSKTSIKQKSESSKTKSSSSSNSRTHHKSHSSKRENGSHSSSTSASKSSSSKHGSSHKSSRSSNKDSSSSQNKNKSSTPSKSKINKNGDGNKDSTNSNVKTEKLNQENKTEINANINPTEIGDFCLPEMSDYEDDPDEVELECLRMFENYEPVEDSNSNEPEATILSNASEQEGSGNTGRHRQAHPGAQRVDKKSIRPPTTSAKSLHSVVSERLFHQKKVLEESSKHVASSKPSQPHQHNSSTHGNNKSNAKVSTNSNKKRIAHVPNVTGLLRPPSTKGSTETGPSPHKKDSLEGSLEGMGTMSRTTTKGTTRVAHTPSVASSKKSTKRPIVSIHCPRGTNKIPTTIRQKVLDQLYDAVLKIVTDPDKAFARGVEEETALEVRSTTKATYISLAVAKVRAIRKEGEGSAQQSRPLLNPPVPASLPNEQRNTIRQLPVLAQPQPSHVNNILPQPLGRCKISGIYLYSELRRITLNEQQLLLNGFPRPHPNGEPGRAFAESNFFNSEKHSPDPLKRTCDRCRILFSVTENGEQIGEIKCTYHPGKKSVSRVNRTLVTSFDCCGDERGSGGCTNLNYHVPKSQPVSETKGFVSAVHEAGPEETMGFNPWDIVALDCEMVYTTGGSELARATFVGAGGQILYDQLVMPQNPILDYNTQFSGLTPEILSRARCSLVDVQAAVLTHLKKNSILIGHSLESDLIALKMHHSSIVDTSVLYPHKRGPPYKRALRMLASEHLHKIIQSSVGGHDSAEDARSALELVQKYVENNR